MKSELQSKLHGLQEELTTALSSKKTIMLELEDGKKHMAVIIAEKHSVHSSATDIKAALESSKTESLTLTSELQSAMQTNAKVTKELNGQITVLKKKVDDITKELSTVVAAKAVDCKNLEQSNRNLQAAQAHLTAIQTEKEALTYELGQEKKNLAVMAAEGPRPRARGLGRKHWYAPRRWPRLSTPLPACRGERSGAANH